MGESPTNQMNTLNQNARWANIYQRETKGQKN